LPFGFGGVGEAAGAAGVFVATIHGCVLGRSSSAGKSRSQSASMNS
jgi:hypothetical protein